MRISFDIQGFEGFGLLLGWGWADLPNPCTLITLILCFKIPLLTQMYKHMSTLQFLIDCKLKHITLVIYTNQFIFVMKLYTVFVHT